MSHERTQNEKVLSFWAAVFSYFIQQQWAISWLDCDRQWKVDCIQQTVMTSLVGGLKRSSKAKLSPQKKIMVTVWWSAAGLIHYSFLNPSKTIASEKYAQQINETYQKLQCLQPALVNRKGPIFSTTTPKHTSHNKCVKSLMNWATKFCLTCLIHLTSQ